MLNTEQEDRILLLRAKGKSYSTISKEERISKQTAVDICKKYEERISALRALELDEMYEKQRITYEERISAHANLMKRIREEIESRDLSDISTDKLIELFIKQNETIREELIEPQFRSREEQERDREERNLLNSISSGI